MSQIDKGRDTGGGRDPAADAATEAAGGTQRTPSGGDRVATRASQLSDTDDAGAAGDVSGTESGAGDEQEP